MPDVIYLGESDVLEFKGKSYHPGDTMHLSAQDLGNLTRQGLRFAHPHSDAERAAIDVQVHPPLYEAPVALVPTGPEPDPAPASAPATSAVLPRAKVEDK